MNCLQLCGGWVVLALFVNGVIAEQSEVYELHGSGTTNPSKYFWKIFDTMEEQAKLPMFMTYRAVGSSTGMAEFVGQESNGFAPYNHFGSGDIPVKESLYQNLTNVGREMVHIPFALGAISFFHSIPREQQPEQGVKLSPCLLSKIFQARITHWDHPDILAENEGLNFGDQSPEIQVVRRTAGSSSTAASTEYMKTANANTIDVTCQWDLSTGSKLSDWPASTTAAVGSGGVARFLEETPYAIGYLDSGHGQALGLPEIALLNDAGYLRSTDANISDAMNREVLPVSPTLSWHEVALYSQPGSLTWPITTMSYIYMDKNVTDLQSTGTLLKAFVQYVMSDAGQSLVEEFGFERLPTWVVEEYNAATIQSIITHPEAANWMFEEEDEVPVKYEGAGKFVLSGKRQSYAEYERSQMQSSIRNLETAVSALEATSPYQLHGSGTTNPSKFFWKLMDEMEEESRIPLFLTYRAVGSGTGMKEHVGNSASAFMPYSDFGSGDIPVKQDLHSQLATPMVHVPFALGAIAVFHSIPGTTEPVKMSPCLLSKVFQRRVRTWDHSDVLAENPHLSVEAQHGHLRNRNIKVVHRSLGSSSTSALTQYMKNANDASQDSNCHWDLSVSSKLDDWPEDTYVGFGSDGVAGFIQENDYAIGYLDAGHGHELELSEVALQNDVGYLVSSAANISEAAKFALEGNVLPQDPTESWHEVQFYSQPGPLTWPITTVSYFYLRQDVTYLGATGTLLLAFVRRVLSPHGQDMCEQFGFNRLPQEMLEYNEATLESIQSDSSAPNWLFEEGSDVPDVYGGTAKFVFSGKRRAYAEYERGLIRGDVTVLQEQVTQLQSRIAELESAATPASPVVEDDDDDDHKTTEAVSVAALILAIIAVLLSLYNCLAPKLCGPASGGSAGCAAPSACTDQNQHKRMSEEHQGLSAI